ncbi:PD-(D/E)XK motif protein [Rhodococcus sp. 5A-K4]|uniref:PD-(D/E)XK motif protein n=1 Tax=Rhodococcus sp. 5A-K4 TaxID=3384442 RepID=UPI0038D448F5
MTDKATPGVLEWSTVEHYLAERLAASYRLSQVASHPIVTYEIGDDGQEVALCVELERSQQAPSTRLPAIHVDRILHRGLRMARIRTTQSELTRDFHDLALSISNRIVIEGYSLDRAFNETIRSWSALLDPGQAATAKRRIGLHGEIAVLMAVGERFGWRLAVESWTGPKSEEHDFVLPDFDLEVKTTTSERRVHTIHGIGQLDSSPGRPLSLISIRMTRGGAVGRSLAQSITAVQTALASEGVEVQAKFARALSESGWTDGSSADERWILRDEPLVLDSKDVPCVDFAGVPDKFRDRILAMRYDIDVTGIEQQTDPPVDLKDLHLP